MTALHDGRTSDLEISPNLWAGWAQVRFFASADWYNDVSCPDY